MSRLAIISCAFVVPGQRMFAVFSALSIVSSSRDMLSIGEDGHLSILLLYYCCCCHYYYRSVFSGLVPHCVCDGDKVTTISEKSTNTHGMKNNFIRVSSESLILYISRSWFFFFFMLKSVIFHWSKSQRLLPHILFLFFRVSLIFFFFLSLVFH